MYIYGVCELSMIVYSVCVCVSWVYVWEFCFLVCKFSVYNGVSGMCVCRMCVCLWDMYVGGVSSVCVHAWWLSARDSMYVARVCHQGVCVRDPCVYLLGCESSIRVSMGCCSYVCVYRVCIYLQDQEVNKSWNSGVKEIQLGSCSPRERVNSSISNFFIHYKKNPLQSGHEDYYS